MSSVLDEVVDGVEPAPSILSVMQATRPAFLLSIDVGTSGVRACLFDDRGVETSAHHGRRRSEERAKSSCRRSSNRSISVNARRGVSMVPSNAVNAISAEHCRRCEVAVLTR